MAQLFSGFGQRTFGGQGFGDIQSIEVFIQVAQLGFISCRGQVDHVVNEILKGQGAVTNKVFGIFFMPIAEIFEFYQIF